MLHKIDVGDNKVVGFRWEGKYDEKGVKQSFVQFLPELQARPEMNLYLEVGSLTEVEAKAIWEEVRFDIKNLQQIVKKIEKVALVTDMKWMRTMAETSATLFPGIDLKAFSFKETDAARGFVTD
ncbi:STAS/SEC14 domain-containing protein [Antarcticibacterium sp. 1MA-6-2]|uniref:STAS/SEC14 domain-containing protein n=1 Tax=Antarcticibacterium sp. 1MA-6-2 TaxID=2908210 RepID=UPI001F26655A|nr:STAS/SEC14 domain-containing protein [Antarcticibacterium sp. 1MA-6-2]UJH91589.1 STAS/SEC14 domain-containing protein [Antarcticibacterium sp. 1MA-6-2]